MTLITAIRIILVFVVLYAGVSDASGLSSTSTSFTETDDLGVTADLKYAFILVRHGMVAPVDRSYSTDVQYQEKWTKGEFTNHGRQLMNKLGRSLATRYSSYIDSFAKYKFYVTTMDTTYGHANAEELLVGLCEGTCRPHIHRKPELDKFQLLRSPQRCPTYATLKNEMAQNEKHDKEETSLFDSLRRCIGETTNPTSEWYVNTREKVYNLWEVLDFELKSMEYEPLCFGADTEPTVRNVANRYLQDAIFGSDEMPQYVVGPLLQEMLDGYNYLNPKFHLHITNDFIFAAVKSVLLQRNIELPEFGETLMVEVDLTGDTRIYTYKPYLQGNNYQQNLFKNDKSTCKFYAIRRLLKTVYQFGEFIHDEIWTRRCIYNIPIASFSSRKPPPALLTPRSRPLVRYPSVRGVQEEGPENPGRAASSERDSTIIRQSIPPLAMTRITQESHPPNHGISVSYGETPLPKSPTTRSPTNSDTASTPTTQRLDSASRGRDQRTVDRQESHWCHNLRRETTVPGKKPSKFYFASRCRKMFSSWSPKLRRTTINPATFRELSRSKHSSQKKTVEPQSATEPRIEVTYPKNREE